MAASRPPRLQSGMLKRKKGRKVALLAGLALVVLSVSVGWTYWKEIRSWYEFRQLFESLGKNEHGRPEYRHWQTGIVFVGLPGGTFDMGSPETEEGQFEDEGPVHKVTLSPFLIAKYEVSQAEWQKVMGSNPSDSKGDALPVEQISWDDCQEFCKKTGLSLPTEVQWEYACRAGTAGPFAGTGNLDEMGWYDKNSGGTTHPVGEKKANDFGLHDMHGNVWELCEDWYQEGFYQESTGARDPLCENSGSGYRVVRGGSWNHPGAGGLYPAPYCRSAARQSGQRSSSGFRVGFRPAWSSP